MIAATVQAVAIALLGGAILHADDVTAGNGKVVNWRSAKNGEDVAHLATVAYDWDKIESIADRLVAYDALYRGGLSLDHDEVHAYYAARLTCAPSAFDIAQAFVSMVGPASAMRAVRKALAS